MFLLNHDSLGAHFPIQIPVVPNLRIRRLVVKFPLASPNVLLAFFRMYRLFPEALAHLLLDFSPCVRVCCHVLVCFKDVSFALRLRG